MPLFTRSRTLQSPKYVEKRRRKAIGLVFIYSICVIAFIGTSLLILRASFFQIDTIAIDSASDDTSSESIREKANSFITGDYIGVIPKSNIFFFPKDEMKKAISLTFRQIDSVDIRRTGLSAIAIAVKSREPAALVCAGFPEDNPENETCFLADIHGYVYAPSLAFASSSLPAYNRYYVPAELADVATGTSFIDENHFAELQKFLNGAARAGLAPLGVLVGDGGEYEMYMKGGTTVYFDDRQPFETSLSNLLVFWQNFLNKNKSGTTTPAFDSINLHFGNTIYYSYQ